MDMKGEKLFPFQSLSLSCVKINVETLLSRMEFFSSSHFHSPDIWNNRSSTDIPKYIFLSLVQHFDVYIARKRCK